MITGNWKQSENEVDASLKQYQIQGLIHPQTNYPEIIITKFPAARVVGKAAGDRTVSIAPLGGRTCHLEIKTWKAKNSHKYSFTGTPSKVRRRAQFNFLLDSSYCHALAYYLVKWRFNGGHDWRLHPVEERLIIPDGLRFNRTEGLSVSSDQGWPEWLDPILVLHCTAKELAR